MFLYYLVGYFMLSGLLVNAWLFFRLVGFIRGLIKARMLKRFVAPAEGKAEAPQSELPLEDLTVFLKAMQDVNDAKH